MSYIYKPHGIGCFIFMKNICYGLLFSSIWFGTYKWWIMCLCPFHFLFCLVLFYGLNHIKCYLLSLFRKYGPYLFVVTWDKIGQRLTNFLGLFPTTMMGWGHSRLLLRCEIRDVKRTHIPHFWVRQKFRRHQSQFYSLMYIKLNTMSFCYVMSYRV